MPTQKRKTKKIKVEKYQADEEQTVQIPAASDEATVDFSTGIKKPDVDSDEKEMDLEVLRTEIKDNLRIAVKAKAKWMELAKEDIDFCLGKQWNEQERLDLEAQRRPVLTFNKIKPILQLVTGHLIQTKARIQAFPEGGEDESFTAVMDKIVDHIEKVSHLNFKLSYLFSGGERAGESWIEFHLDYDEDPIFGQLKIPNLGPFKIFMDPAGTEYDLSDCGWGHKVIPMSKARLKALYPEKQTEIEQNADDSLSEIVKNVQQVDSGDESDYGNSPSIPRGGQTTEDLDELKGDQKQCTVVEYWKREYVDKYFVYFVSDGSIQEYDSEEEAMAEVERRKQIEAETIRKETAMKMQGMVQSAMLKQAPPEVQAGVAQGQVPPPPVEEPPVPPVDPSQVEVKFAIRKRRVARMKVAVIVGNIFLTDGLVDSPFEPYYHGFPFFHYIAEWAPECDDAELRVQSLVRSLKDPQREKNKSRSQFLHILNTSANSGWIGDEDALTDQQWQDLKSFGSVPGLTVRKKAGRQLERIHPVEPSVANQVREKAAADDFKEVSGINADLLAMDSSANPSGRAIALKIKQAVTILQPSFEDFRYTKIMIGQFLFSIIPAMFDAAKVEKILGPKFMQEYGLDRGIIASYLTMVEDNKYNIQISESGQPDTLRDETFENLMQLVQGGMPLPPDLLMEFMNVPNKQEVMNRVKEYQQQVLAAQAQQPGAGAKAPPR